MKLIITYILFDIIGQEWQTFLRLMSTFSNQRYKSCLRANYIF